MKLTEVTLTLVSTPQLCRPNRGLLGYAKVVVDRKLMIRDIRMIRLRDSGRVFLAFPSRKKGVYCCEKVCRAMVDPGDAYCSRCGAAQSPLGEDDTLYTGHRDCVFPLNHEARLEIEGPILEAYDFAMAHPGLGSFRPSYDGPQVIVDVMSNTGVRRDN